MENRERAGPSAFAYSRGEAERMGRRMTELWTVGNLIETIRYCAEAAAAAIANANVNPEVRRLAAQELGLSVLDLKAARRDATQWTADGEPLSHRLSGVDATATSTRYLEILDSAGIVFLPQLVERWPKLGEIENCGPAMVRFLGEVYGLASRGKAEHTEHPS